MNLSRNIISSLKDKKVEFFTGVPDSLLKNFCNELQKLSKKKHVISSNEGGAVSIAAGYYLATKKIPLVYLQNSGLGNIINPISSIIHKEIYGIPMILFIGWRGAKNIKDEIQHKVQGKITLDQLRLLNIKYKVFNKRSYKNQLSELIEIAEKNNQPVALIFRKGDLENNQNTKTRNKKINKYTMLTRSEFIDELVKNSKNFKIISTTGFTSRELYQTRMLIDNTSNNDFYMVGGMGHTSMVALGYSLGSKKKTICLDGDGSFLMHMGSSVISSKFGAKNFKYILLNNLCHESVGKQPTAINIIDLEKFVLSIGYKKYFLIDKKDSFKKIFKTFLNCSGPSFLNVLINPNTTKNLLRIKNLQKIKRDFIN